MSSYDGPEIGLRRKRNGVAGSSGSLGPKYCLRGAFVLPGGSAVVLLEGSAVVLDEGPAVVLDESPAVVLDESPAAILAEGPPVASSDMFAGESLMMNEFAICSKGKPRLYVCSQKMAATQGWLE